MVKRLTCHVEEQLNAARGSLKTVFHKALWTPCAKLLFMTCQCAPQSYFDFHKALVRAGIWPIEDVFKTNSAAQIIARANAFVYRPTSSGCSGCKQNYKSIVDGAAKRTQRSFDGLCLDCIHYPFDNNDIEKFAQTYASRDESDEWDEFCAVAHGQPTRYFSFCAQREENQLLVKRVQARARSS